MTLGTSVWQGGSGWVLGTLGDTEGTGPTRGTGQPQPRPWAGTRITVTPGTLHRAGPPRDRCQEPGGHWGQWGQQESDKGGTGQSSGHAQRVRKVQGAW